MLNILILKEHLYQVDDSLISVVICKTEFHSLFVAYIFFITFCVWAFFSIEISIFFYIATREVKDVMHAHSRKESPIYLFFVCFSVFLKKNK